MDEVVQEQNTRIVELEKPTPSMARDVGADRLVYKRCMIDTCRDPAMLWLLVASLLVATNSRQKGQARCGERQSNGPCIMLHPNTTLHSTTPWGPCSRCEASESKPRTSSSLGSGGKHAVSVLQLQTATALSNDCQFYEYEQENAVLNQIWPTETRGVLALFCTTGTLWSISTGTEPQAVNAPHRFPQPLRCGPHRRS